MQPFEGIVHHALIDGVPHVFFHVQREIDANSLQLFCCRPGMLHRNHRILFAVDQVHHAITECPLRQAGKTPAESHYPTGQSRFCLQGFQRHD